MTRPAGAAARPIVVEHVTIELDADAETPVSAYRKLTRGGSSYAFLLESVEAGERIGRYSYVGVRPRRVVAFDREDDADALSYLERYQQRHHVIAEGDLPPFTGGLVGYVSYEYVARIEPRLRFDAPDETGFPEAVWMDFDLVVCFDNVRRTAFAVAQVRGRDAAELTEARARAGERLHKLRQRLAGPLTPRADLETPSGQLAARTTRRDYLASVRTAKRHIERGDCQQIVVSQRFDAALPVDPLTVYRALRRINPSPYVFLVQLGEHALVGSSPEPLVRVETRESAPSRVTVRPIAGTRRRGKTADEDDRLAAELLGDEKENAEHMMLVDLGRNDVGRVAAIGSVDVPRLRVVERYSHVMHLVSEVTGDLAPDRTPVDALRAAFPAGTVSGSPKVRAIEIVAGLEPALRGPYAGAVGYASPTGDLELAIAIRTVVCGPDKLSVQAGAGIVYDSDPAAEWDETVHKASAAFRAVAGGDA